MKILRQEVDEASYIRYALTAETDEEKKFLDDLSRDYKSFKDSKMWLGERFSLEDEETREPIEGLRLLVRPEKGDSE